MKHSTYYKILAGYKTIIFFLLFISLFFSFCQEDPQLWKLKSEEQVIGDYIANDPENYSEFTKLIESTGLNALMKIRGPYTLMLPTNEAMFEYYRQKNINSFMDFTDTLIRYNLALNHIIASEINTNDIGLGALREPNGLGDYLVTEFRGSDILINKTAYIIKRNIRCSNGFIHVIDKVIEPVTQDIYSLISSNPSFKIFSEGLKLTGLKDTLGIIEFPYGSKTARTRFTVLAVPDTIYQRYGINDVTDLINWCGANADSLTALNNPFYRYIEYHCMTGSYFLSDFSSGIFPVLSRDNNISVIIGADYKINENSKTKKYTGFIIPESNYPAKNGAMHTINDLLPVIDPDPATIIFETTDFFDFKQGEFFQTHYQRFNDGENTFADIHWVGDYMQYHFKVAGTGGTLKSDDCLQMIGWFSLSVTFPKVMKGKWEVSIYQPNWQDVTSCRVYLDDVITGINYLGPRTGGVGGIQKVAEVDFKTSSRHTIRLENYFYGMVFWDYVQFKPIP